MKNRTASVAKSLWRSVAPAHLVTGLVAVLLRIPAPPVAVYIAAARFSSRVGDTKQNTRRSLTCGCLVLATSYSRTAYRRTTIGAAAFHFRVRNGNGWGHRARVTRDPSRTDGCGASRRRGSLETMSIFQRTADSLISTYRVWEHAL